MGRQLSFFIVFVVVFISDDSLLFGTNSNKSFVVFRYLLYFGILLYLLVKYRFKIDRRLFVPLIIILLSYLVTMIINVDFRPGYFLGFLVVFLAALISNRLKYVDFAFYYNKIIYILSAFSLIVFFFAILIPQFFKIFPIIKNYGGVEFYSLLICNVMKTGFSTVNIGIFREAGVFVIFLIIAVINELFFNNEVNYWRLLVYTAAIITSFSTAGYIILAFLLFVYVLKTKNIEIKIGFSAIIALFLIFFLHTLVTEVFAKFNPQYSEYRSTLARVSSFVIPLMIFFEHVFGVGLSNFGGFYTDYSIKYFGIAFNPSGESTNTLLNTFAIFGILYGSLIIYGLIKFSRIFGSTKINMITVFIALLMISSIQELRFSLLFNLFIMYGIINSDAPYNIESKNKLLPAR